jgi:hypothetical protein
MIVKVNLKSGKILWQSPRVGSAPIVSGPYVYTTDSQVSGIDMMGSMMGSDRGTPVHWRLFRISPSSGKDQWEYYRKGAPLSVHPREKRILIRSKEELRMLKFL